MLLTRSFRFRPDSGIGALAAAVNAGDAARALAIIAAGPVDLEHRVLDEAGLRALLAARLVPFFRRCLDAGPPTAVLAALGGLRVLCAVRDGPFGVAGINRLAESVLSAAGVIDPAGRRHYPGRPLLVTVNDAALGLYNGDLGILLAEPAAAGPGPAPLRAWFPADGGARRLLPARLPAVETVYAMTVHKSQGSEFDEVILILPPWPSRAVTRELLYTGITRARRAVTLIAPPERLAEAIARPVRRASGLDAALWQPRAHDPG